jgi:hypothetical protein
MAMEETIMVAQPPPGTMTAVTFDAHELAVIVFEAMAGVRRPAGMSTEDALREIQDESPQNFAICKHIANRVVDHIGERFRAAQTEPMQ